MNTTPNTAAALEAARADLAALEADQGKLAALVTEHHAALETARAEHRAGARGIDALLQAQARLNAAQDLLETQLGEVADARHRVRDLEHRHADEQDEAEMRRLAAAVMLARARHARRHHEIDRALLDGMVELEGIVVQARGDRKRLAIVAERRLRRAGRLPADPRMNGGAVEGYISEMFPTTSTHPPEPALDFSIPGFDLEHAERRRRDLEERHAPRLSRAG